MQIEIAMAVCGVAFIGFLIAGAYFKRPWLGWLGAAVVLVYLGLLATSMERTHDRQESIAHIQSKLENITARSKELKTRLDANNAETQTLLQQISDPKPPLSAAADQSRRDRLAVLMKENAAIAKESETIQKELTDVQKELDASKQ